MPLYMTAKQLVKDQLRAFPKTLIETIGAIMDGKPGKVVSSENVKWDVEVCTNKPRETRLVPDGEYPGNHVLMHGTFVVTNCETGNPVCTTEMIVAKYFDNSNVYPELYILPYLDGIFGWEVGNV